MTSNILLEGAQVQFEESRAAKFESSIVMYMP